VTDILSKSHSFNYEQLHIFSLFIAKELNSKSQINDRTVVITDRSSLGVAAIVGTFLSQTVYVPIDSQDPMDRVSFILKDSSPTQIIFDSKVEHLLAELDNELVLGIKLINLDDLYREYSANQIDLRSAYEEITKDNSYMIYTSGTTGRPKGVLVGEGTLGPLMNWIRDSTKAQQTKKTLQYYSWAFDPSLLEIFSTLLMGNELVVCDHETKKDLLELVTQISQHQIERLFLPITLVQMLSEEFGREAHLLSSVREINCGGDRMVITPTIKKLIESINKEKGGETLDLNNQYGPTEATIMVTQQSLRGDPVLWPEHPSIGTALAGTKLYLLNENLKEVSPSEKGMLYIGGDLLAKGYWNNPELTQENFIEKSGLGNFRLYKTGDIASIDKEGNVSFFGRVDHQIKINGLRVECSEIENLIKEEIKSSGQKCDEAVVLLCERKSSEDTSEKFLAATLRTDDNIESSDLKNKLANILPSGMVPTYFKVMKELPLTSNGKIDRNSLKIEIEKEIIESTRETLIINEDHSMASDLMELFLSVLKEVSPLSHIDPKISLFEQSLTSLQAIKFVHRVNKLFKTKNYSFKLNIADLYVYPQLSDLETYLCETKKDSIQLVSRQNRGDNNKVAIVGMSCRFPEAESLEDFWKLIQSGESGIHHFSKEEISHPSQEGIKHEVNFVPARGILKNIDLFDAQNFGIPPRVAQVMDPQMRLLLEQSHLAINNAIYLNQKSTGVFFGMSNNTYLEQVEQLNSEMCDQVGRWNLATLNEKDYIATQVAHKLNLMGPAISIHTACSTSLVAMIQAVRAIQNGDCESALCGGIHIDSRHKTGHLYQEGSIFAKEGSCRPYDADSSGTIFSDGIGVVVLKDYELAKKDGNQILGVVAGCGLGNDGADKTSFTAPSVIGQRESIQKALSEADISADEISFIEGHGTATPVGDPIEVQALVEALESAGLSKDSTVGLSSVKAQIGHTVAASGIAGVIKAVLCLRNNIIPGIANFQQVNPLLNIEDTPFEITKISRENTDLTKKYCGISSFGVGGTNAHVIIERIDSESINEGIIPQEVVIPVSAKSLTRLVGELNNLIQFLDDKKTNIVLGKLARAMTSKKALAFRKAYVVSSIDELRKKVNSDLANLKSIEKVTSFNKVIFAVPGQGTQYAFLGKKLYDQFIVFKDAVDLCCTLYKDHFDCDLKNTLFESGNGLINFTQYTQPCLFIFQYSMLSLMESLGIEADYLIGHSVGEFALAAHNNQINIKDALILIGKRGQLMAELPAGKMISIRENSDKVSELLNEFKDKYKIGQDSVLSIATINSDSLCVIGGESDRVDEFLNYLSTSDILVKELRTSHAFHTEMMTPILSKFTQELKDINFYPCSKEQIASSQQSHPIISKAYWVEHIVAPVNFKKSLNILSQKITDSDNAIAFDIGPRFVAGQLIKQNIKNKNIRILPLNKGNPVHESDDFLNALARAWEKGLSIDFESLYSNQSWCETPIPYLDRKSYWAGYPINKEYKKNENIADAKGNKEEIMSNFKNTLRKFVEEKSGFTDLCLDASFLELGLDSLLLTQLSIDLKNEFKVEVGFRDLMDSIDTIDSLGDFLIEKNPSLNKTITAAPAQKSKELIDNNSKPAPLPVQNEIPTPTRHFSETNIPARAPVAMSSDMGSIIQGQMDLMKMHLELMAGGSVSNVASNHVTAQTPEVTKEATTEIIKDTAKRENPENSENSENEEEALKGTVNTSKVAFGAQARVNTIREEEAATIKESVESIIKTYCAKTPKSKAHTQKYRKFNADPRVVTGFRPEIKELTYPLVVDRSKNQRLWDIDGNEYVDVTCGFGSNFFGNQNERITKALHDQLDRGFEIGPQHALAGECAELICELTGNERAAFCNTGSEAVLGALRISRTITGRQKVVMFKGSYHGINDEVIVRGRGDGKSMPAAAGINPSATKDMILLDYGTQEALEYLRANASDLAAVIVEPVQSRRSDFQPKEFLQEVREITKESGSAFIFDEVITGFRIAVGGAQEYFGIKADLVTYGKIIGGGMPIGIVSGEARFMDALDGGTWQFGDDSLPTTAITYFAGTFVRHPLALRALKEALLILKEGGKELYYGINQKAQKFVDQLNLFSEVFGAPIHVDNFGGVLKPRFTDTGKNNDLFFALMRIEGVHCYDGFPWFVTLGHEDGDLEIVQEIWKKCIIKMQTLGLFPKGLISPQGDLNQENFIIPPKSGSVLIKNDEGKPAWKEASSIKNSK